MRTLQQRGYVYVLNERKRVYPTRRLSAIAEAIARHDPILERLTPILTRLSRSTGETVLLGRRQGDRVIYLEVVEAQQTIRYSATPGDGKPLHASAIGKSMLGAMADADRKQLLRRLKLTRVTPATITDKAALEADIAAGKARGYFITRGENVAEVMAVAVARDIGGEPYGIAIAGPIGRIEARLEPLAKALAEATAGLDHPDIDGLARDLPAAPAKPQRATAQPRPVRRGRRGK